ncbi:hypothetical protein [Nocardiopsis synnemataformans]|uniref:hypothetical protein n=1 Tax=Nocardiopsis synnemataformans TaxID=61305 RepID=UPI003EC02F24
MPEPIEPTDPNNNPNPEPPEGDDEELDLERAKAKIHKANQEAAGLRSRMKELEDKATRLDELENANKSEQQKAQEAAAALEKRATAAEQRALRLEVAAAKGLTTAQAKRLVGSTQEELEADADELLETFGTAPTPADSIPRRPNERLRPGGSGTPAPPEETDPRKLAAKIPRR